MDNFTAVGIAEGFIPCEDEARTIEAWQHLIDTDLAWQLQGLFEINSQATIKTMLAWYKDREDFERKFAAT